MNISNILNSSLKILNVADKTIPLIKEINPTLTNIKKRFTKKNTEKTKNEQNKKETKVSINKSLTFFV